MSLTKFGIRYYDPTLGRFTQPDPTGADPHYTYARDNPCNFSDPSGAISCTNLRLLAAGFGAAAAVTGALSFTPLAPAAAPAAAIAGVGAGAFGLSAAICQATS